MPLGCTVHVLLKPGAFSGMGLGVKIRLHFSDAWNQWRTSRIMSDRGVRQLQKFAGLFLAIFLPKILTLKMHKNLVYPGGGARPWRPHLDPFNGNYQWKGRMLHCISENKVNFRSKILFIVISL